MAAKIISQRKFAKLAAGTGSLSQPPGALARISNLIFSQRGSLQVAAGSAQVPPASSGFPIRQHDDSRHKLPSGSRWPGPKHVPDPTPGSP